MSWSSVHVHWKQVGNTRNPHGDHPELPSEEMEVKERGWAYN